MSKVKIVYNRQSYSAKIDDISPDVLQECFSLQMKPKFLFDEKAHEIIDSKYWKDELKPGHIYRIKEQGNNFDTRNTNEEEAAKKNETVEDFDNIVLHSLIASSAVYKMEHKKDDETLVKEYLHEQIENHFFEYIIPSKHGENFYMIAKENEKKRIYIAFRGTKNLMDWKHNLKVTLRYFFILIYVFCFYIFSLK